MAMLHRLSVCSALLPILCVAPLRAAEQVTLRSGFSVRCTSHEAISADMVRLHLSAAGGVDNYMDVSRNSVAAVENAPDEPRRESASEPRPGTSLQPAEMKELLQGSGARHNVNVALLESVVKAESGGNIHAVSRTGARGLMQLMPSTANALGVRDSFSAEGNVNGGGAYLDQLLTRYHDNLALALAAYNAGPGAVDRYHGIPPFRETQQYVARVIREFNRRVQAQAAKAALAAATTPATASRVR